MDYFVIIISAIFVSNIVLTQFLGICPFLGVSTRISTSVGMGGAILFVMTLATMVTWMFQYYILEPMGLVFMQTIVFILVIAALVQMVEIILKKISPSLYQALGIFLPLITTNCAVLGVAILTVQKHFDLMQGVVFAIAAGIREHLEIMEVPKGMRGVPIALVTAGILALAFMGFTGMVK